MLPHKERLTRDRDIKRTLKTKQYTSRSSLLYLVGRENSLKNSRVAVVTPKKLGSAVERNRIRRLFKAAFSQAKSSLTKNLDLVLFPSREAKQKKTKDVELALKKALSKLNL